MISPDIWNPSTEAFTSRYVGFPLGAASGSLAHGSVFVVFPQQFSMQ